LLVQLADLFNRGFQLVIVGEETLYLWNLLFAEADLANATARIADSEDRHGMTFAALTLGATGAVADSALEQGAAKEVAGWG
jgi:hypothetical protein